MRFYLSLKDSLMRIFISENIAGLLSKLGLKNGEFLTHPWVTRAVENAQRKVIYKQCNELMGATECIGNYQSHPRGCSEWRDARIYPPPKV